MQNQNDYRLKMRDCVLLASVFLQLDGVTDALEAEPYAPEGETARLVDLLVRCGNLVLGEIAADYLPLKTIEITQSLQKKIRFDALSKKAVDIYAVRRFGKSVPFVQFFDGITVPYDGAYDVEYSYEPLPLDISGESDYTGGRLNARTAAYGIACEYCLISGMTEDAVLWDKRYKDALASAAIVKNEKTVKLRSWR